MRKAEADAIAVRELAGNSEITDEIGRLLQLLQNAGIELPPPNAEQLDELTIYAVPMRYDELLDAEPLDREATLELVGAVSVWANDISARDST